MISCVLSATTDKSVVLLDIPRSIELAQVLPGQKPVRRLVSCKALETPWQAKSAKKSKQPDMSQSPSAAIDELMTRGVVHRALENILQNYNGPWSLARLVDAHGEESAEDANATRKRKQPDIAGGLNSNIESFYFPANSHYCLGSIQGERAMFLKAAPIFDLIILDPPWPSRSVRRKKDRYSTAYDMQETQDLLSLIPVASHLEADGLVAVWITNKPAVLDLLRSAGGIFDQWGVELIGEWTWVKITNKGDAIVDVDSTWRKPWERLLIARKRGSSMKLNPERKVILGVPDLHSRKPNLRELFNGILPNDYLGLEVFSRNLTAGWWSWGDQTTMFQQRDHWVEDSIPLGKKQDRGQS